MLKLAIAAAAVLAVGAQQSIEPPTPRAQGQQCLHGSSERPEQRARREQALKVAHQINLAEMKVVPKFKSPNSPWFEFQPLQELPNVPQAPPGFAVKLFTDGRTYSFSMKDMQDPCQYAIFSDQDRWIYEATPTTNAVILPATP